MPTKDIADRLRRDCDIVAWDLHIWGDDKPTLLEKVTEIVQGIISEEIDYLIEHRGDQ